MTVYNHFLKATMQQVYRNRHPLPNEPLTVVRHEIADEKPMCEVWFMSEGCAYDREGGCTMCNYGKGHYVDSNAILDRLRTELSTLPKENYNLIINPSGSFLDEREVSLLLRNGIYELLDKIPFESLTVESRADVISLQALDELRTRYSNKRVSVEIGVETLNHWLLKNAINKGVTVSQVEHAIKLIRDTNLISVANIGLGIPFIGEKANISYARESVLNALRMGFDSVILFPYHINPGTLLEVLCANGRYQSVSLWSLIKVLSTLPSEYLSKVNISWYRNYYTDKTKIIESPCTCLSCRDKVLLLLDMYKSAPCQKTLAPLSTFECKCREEWRNKLANQCGSIDISNVEDDYRFLSKHFQIRNDLLEETLFEIKEPLYADH